MKIFAETKISNQEPTGKLEMILKELVSLVSKYFKTGVKVSSIIIKYLLE